jgi:hypothetical protein
MKTTAAILFLTAVSFAQAARVPPVTRTVQLFGELERKLEAAEPSQKAQFLADDFEERLCAEPGTPVPRDAWLQKSAHSEARFSQEAVHMYGDLAVYSGLRNKTKDAETIVDTWKQADGGWKLAVRYRCPASGPKPAQATFPKRY